MIKSSDESKKWKSVAYEMKEAFSDPLRTFRNEKMNTRVYIYKTKTLVTYTYTSVRTTLVKTLILKRRERE